MLALLLAAVLIFLSPGLPCYEALASTVKGRPPAAGREGKAVVDGHLESERLELEGQVPSSLGELESSIGRGGDEALEGRLPEAPEGEPTLLQTVERRAETLPAGDAASLPAAEAAQAGQRQFGESGSRPGYPADVPLLIEGPKPLPALAAPSAEKAAPLSPKAEGFLHVIPDAEGNKLLWRYVISLSISAAAGAFIGASILGSSGAMILGFAGVALNRLGSIGGEALGSVIGADLVNRAASPKVILMAAGLGRFIGFGAILVAFFGVLSGHMSTPGFDWLVLGAFGVAGICSGLGNTANSVGLNRVVGAYPAYATKANILASGIPTFVGAAISYAVFVTKPWIESFGLARGADIIGLVGGWFGLASLPFAPWAQVHFFSMMVLAAGAPLYLAYAAWVYFVRFPASDITKAQGSLWAEIKKDPALRALVRGVAVGMSERRLPFLSPLPRKGSAIAEIESALEPLLRRLDLDFETKVQGRQPWAQRMLKGLKLIWNDRFLFWTLALGTVGFLTTSAFFYPLLERAIKLAATGGAAAPLGKEGIENLFNAVLSLGYISGLAPMFLWKDRPMIAKEEALARFAGRLKDGGFGLKDDELAKTREAVDEAIRETRLMAGADKTGAWTPQTLGAEIVRRAAAKAPAKAAPLLERAGLGEELSVWLDSQFEPVMREARVEARTGRDRLERFWRWMTLVYAAGILADMGGLLMLLSPWDALGISWLWWSAGLLFVSALAQVPAGIAAASLTQRLIQRRYRQNMGDIYGTQNFYVSISVVVGLVTWLLLAGPSAEFLFWLVGGALALDATARVLMFFLALRGKPSA